MIWDAFIPYDELSDWGCVKSIESIVSRYGCQTHFDRILDDYAQYVYGSHYITSSGELAEKHLLIDIGPLDD